MSESKIKKSALSFPVTFEKVEEVLSPISTYINKPLPPYLFTYWNKL